MFNRLGYGRIKRECVELFWDVKNAGTVTMETCGSSPGPTTPRVMPF